MRYGIWFTVCALGWLGCGEDSTPTTSSSEPQQEDSMEDTSEADGAPLEEDSVESTEQDTLVTEEELSDSDTSNSEEDSADAPLSCLDWCVPAETCAEWSVERCTAECERAMEWGCGSECFGEELGCQGRSIAGTFRPHCRLQGRPYGTGFRHCGSSHPSHNAGRLEF